MSLTSYRQTHMCTLQDKCDTVDVTEFIVIVVCEQIDKGKYFSDTRSLVNGVKQIEINHCEDRRLSVKLTIRLNFTRQR